MKLYLSSYGIGDHPEALQALVGRNKRAAVIVNAQDHKSPSERSIRVDHGFTEMKSLGFEPEELDLRNYFGKQAKLAADLKKFGLLWIRGGNVFILMRAMEYSGFFAAVEPLVRSELLVYAGFSAGSCVAAPTLKGLDLVDDKSITPEGYNDELVWSGLNFVPYAIAPHYQSDHPESAAVNNTVAYFQQHAMPHRTLHDGQAIVIHGDSEFITD